MSEIFLAGDFSVLQVNFNLVRFAGYFLIQIYVPCILIVVLSFVGFFINREATSDRVGLGQYIRSIQIINRSRNKMCFESDDLSANNLCCILYFVRITGVTSILTLSTISLDSRSDLPKVIM